MLDFSLPELDRSQSTFSTDPEVLQNCAGFTLRKISGSSKWRMFCSNRFDIMHVVCTDLLSVVCIGLLSAEFSTVNTGLGRLIFWKTSVSFEYSRRSGYHKLSTYIDYLNFQPKSSTFSKTLTRKYQKL